MSSSFPADRSFALQCDSGDPLAGFRDRFLLEDPSLRSDATAEEIEFLKKLRFTRKRPTPLYYYRELQNLRDPLHFRRGADVQ